MIASVVGAFGGAWGVCAWCGYVAAKGQRDEARGELSRLRAENENLRVRLRLRPVIVP